LKEINTNEKIGRHKTFFGGTVMVAAILTLATLTVGLTVTPVQAGGPGPSACPDPGMCTCNKDTGVMTNHAMEPPFNRINNGCTEDGWF
jgi:hypothetical protein